MDLNRFDGIQLNPADPGALTPIAAAKRATATAAFPWPRAGWQPSD